MNGYVTSSLCFRRQKSPKQTLSVDDPLGPFYTNHQRLWLRRGIFFNVCDLTIAFADTQCNKTLMEGIAWLAIH